MIDPNFQMVGILHRDLGVLTSYMRKPETPVGESNGSRYSVWEAIENTGCNMRQFYLSVLFSLFSLISSLPPCQILLCYVYTQDFHPGGLISSVKCAQLMTFLALILRPFSGYFVRDGQI